MDDPEIATRIAQYEMAFRMQTSVPELMDMSDEPPDVLELYGTRGGRRIVRLQLPAGPAAGGTRACGSSSSIIATGTTTGTSRTTSRSWPARWTRALRR